MTSEWLEGSSSAPLGGPDNPPGCPGHPAVPSCPRVTRCHGRRRISCLVYIDNSSAVPTDEATPAPRVEGNESC